MEYRRYGKTEVSMPVLTCGGMRFQSQWNDKEDTPPESDKNVVDCVHRALELGMNHIETARGYGSSEFQLGKVLPTLDRSAFRLQSKVGPHADVAKFVENFEHSMRLLGVDYLDFFSFHGINDEASFEATQRCMDTALKWQEQGRIRHIGFSTHGPTDILVKAVETGAFAYINLHWFYIMQNNWPAIEAATRRDMGVFIISPNDKAGMLQQPSEKLRELCAPLHPMVFNGLFCLSRPEIHTLSIGASRPEEYNTHLETVAKIGQASELLPPIVARLEEAMNDALGEDWARTWEDGLPEWHETPGEINIPVILRLYNLAKAYDLFEYGNMRYNLLGHGDNWFPGEKAEKVGEHDLSACLAQSPYADCIPAILAETHEMLKGEERSRLQDD